MNIKHPFLLLFILLAFGCKQEKLSLVKIEGKQIPIDSSLQTNPDIEAYIKPYREHITKDVDSVLAYSIGTYSKTDGEYNTAVGNFMADVIYEQANPVFKSRTGKDIDMVLLNHGGIRSIISKGNISTRTAFELMPFENSIAVVALKGSKINELVTYLKVAKRAHPISKLKLVLNQNFDVVEATIRTKPIDTLKTYYVATSDFLYEGGDNMTFFKPNDSVYNINYKIRNALIDYFKKVDTINPVIDDRFIQLK